MCHILHNGGQNNGGGGRGHGTSDAFLRNSSIVWMKKTGVSYGCYNKVTHERFYPKSWKIPLTIETLSISLFGRMIWGLFKGNMRAFKDSWWTISRYLSRSMRAILKSFRDEIYYSFSRYKTKHWKPTDLSESLVDVKTAWWKRTSAQLALLPNWKVYKAFKANSGNVIEHKVMRQTVRWNSCN